MELQGALFFGSGERLASEIEAQTMQETKHVVLDLRRITEIDSTGSQILLALNGELAMRGTRLILSLRQPSETADQLAESGVLQSVGEDRVFRDLDRALQRAEDDLLRADARSLQEEEEISLAETSIATGFSAADLTAVQKHCERRAYPAAREIFQEGSPGDELFVVAKGSASAFLRKSGGGDIRLVTFGQGTLFGELAILDSGPRSASVAADTELVCHVLSRQGFAALSEKSPATAIKLLANLGRLLSHRLREANRTIQQLEE
jgi:CRP-like cAMP-binding protein/ABC-type transporter Mla MlaB component